MTSVRRAGIVLAAFAIACRGQPKADTPRPSMQGDSASVEGVVKVVGSDPFAQVVLETRDGEQVAVVGDLRPELANLVGLTVRVVGRPGGAAPPVDRSIEVQTYEALDVRGDPVYVGTLERVGDGYRLRGGTVWELVSVPDALAANVGAKVWVAGQRGDGRITVSVYGVIKSRGDPR
jgi:hypothetical protein